MSVPIHLVGSIGLDSVEEVFTTVGTILGPYLQRVPDGEVGGRREWISWQAPLFRASPYLEMDPFSADPQALGPLRLAHGVQSEEVRFGELGYYREARGSYVDFVEAKQRGDLPAHVRFQVDLPTPYAALGVARLSPQDFASVFPAYERAMLREAERLCQAIPHADLAIQWDVCQEMLMWDGRWDVPYAPWQPFVGMAHTFAQNFASLARVVPPDVELGFHLCYGDRDAVHYVQPQDATKLVELASLIATNAPRPLTYIHMPVPIDRVDDAYYAPLRKLELGPETMLYLGVVHAQDGAAGARRRMSAASKYAQRFGIASECGISRGRGPDVVLAFLNTYAEIAGAQGL